MDCLSLSHINRKTFLSHYTSSSHLLNKPKRAKSSDVQRIQVEASTKEYNRRRTTGNFNYITESVEVKLERGRILSEHVQCN